MSNNIAYLNREVKRWAERAEQSYAKVELSTDDHCRRTMLRMAKQAEQLAEQASTMALALSALAEKRGMLSKDGLHPYRAGLFFILREVSNARHTSRKAQASVIAGDVPAISNWPLVRCLAHSFGKRGAEVARDLIETHRALEDGTPTP